jgi:hypothetical protein
VRFTDHEIAQFRNEKTGVIEIERDGYRKPLKVYMGQYSPSYSDLAAHIINQKEKSIFVCNSGSGDELLLLADIDNKDGRGDADVAAEYLSQTYLGGQTHVESSTFGLGRHVYFRLDTTMQGVSFPRDDRSDIWHWMSKFSQIVRADPTFAAFGVSFDEGGIVYGLAKSGH